VVCALLEVEGWSVGFVECQEVGEDLSGVPEVRESVDNGDGRVLREFLRSAKDTS
jgi:hypothetical protein